MNLRGRGKDCGSRGASQATAKPLCRRLPGDLNPSTILSFGMPASTNSVAMPYSVPSCWIQILPSLISTWTVFGRVEVLAPFGAMKGFFQKRKKSVVSCLPMGYSDGVLRFSYGALMLLLRGCLDVRA